MKISSSFLVVLLTASTSVFADEHGMSHAAMQGMHHVEVGHASSVQGHRAVGVLNSIDLQHHKINMTHGPVVSLKWPGMTMNFNIKDTSILKGIKPGQKVTFEIIKEAPRKFYVSKISPLK